MHACRSTLEDPTEAILAGATPLAVAWIGAMLVTALEIARRQRQLGPLPAWGALAFPAPVALFVAITGAALVDRVRRAPVRWRGRSVVTTIALCGLLAATPAAMAGEPAKPAPAKTVKAAPAKPAPATTAKPAPNAAPAAAYKIEVVKLPAQPVIFQRVTAPGAELGDKLKAVLLGMLASAASSGLDIAGPPYVRYLHREPVFEVEAGLPVAKAPPAEPGAATQPGTLPAGEVATLLHVGPHPQLPAAHDALAKWLVANQRTAAGPAWEVYLTNPVTTPDPNKQRTKIFVPLAPRKP